MIVSPSGSDRSASLRILPSAQLSFGCRTAAGPNIMFKLTPINVPYGQEERTSPKLALAICTWCFF